MTHLTQAIPLLDLKRQYEPFYLELEESFRAFLRSGKFILGPEVSTLETDLANYLGVHHTLGVSNGTDALFLCLRTVGIGFGDKVLTTPFTFFATVSAILGTGALPVFADLDEKTFCLDPVKAEETLSKDKDRKIKAIVVVHLYGQPADMDAFQALSKKYQIPLIEDAAQAIGSEYKGKKAGSLGQLAAFSFYPSKNLGALGDAGLISTNETLLYERAHRMRVHGSKQVYIHDTIGGNFRIDALQALVLRRFLPHIEVWKLKRQIIAQNYTDALKPLNEMIDCPLPSPETIHGFHQYTLRIKVGSRDQLKAVLAENKIDSCVYYPIPCHKQKALEGHFDTTPSLPKAEKAAQEVLSIPIFPDLSPLEQQRVIDAIFLWAKANA